MEGGCCSVLSLEDVEHFQMKKAGTIFSNTHPSPAPILLLTGYPETLWWLPANPQTYPDQIQPKSQSHSHSQSHPESCVCLFRARVA